MNFETAPHLAPDRCFVCGDADHGATFTQTGACHDFWSNAEADAHFQAQDRRSNVRYSDGTTNPETHCVAEHRPY